MALGGVVLGGIYAGPVLAIGGFVVAGQGEKALTQATEYQAKVNTEIAKLEATEEFLGQVKTRINELSALVLELNERAVAAIERLDPSSSNYKREDRKFRKVVLLLKGFIKLITPMIKTLIKLITLMIKTLINQVDLKFSDFCKNNYNLQKAVTLVKAVILRLNSILKTLITQLDLKYSEFERARERRKLHQAALLVTALTEIIETPVLDSQGNLNPSLYKYQRKTSLFGR